jgi:hypothetical protein
MDAAGRGVTSRHQVRRLLRGRGVVDDHHFEARVVLAEQRVKAGSQATRRSRVAMMTLMNGEAGGGWIAESGESYGAGL